MDLLSRSLFVFVACVYVRNTVRYRRKEILMPIHTASDARANLYRLLDQAAESHEPIVITGKRSTAVLIAEEDWRSIQETLHLLAVPGMRESIIAARKEPLAKSARELDW